MLNFIKYPILLALMSMLSWHCFLGIRDSDKVTFENRIRETIKLLETNSEWYRRFA